VCVAHDNGRLRHCTRIEPADCATHVHGADTVVTRLQFGTWTSARTPSARSASVLQALQRSHRDAYIGALLSELHARGAARPKPPRDDAAFPFISLAVASFVHPSRTAPFVRDRHFESNACMTDAFGQRRESRMQEELVLSFTVALPLAMAA